LWYIGHNFRGYIESIQSKERLFEIFKSPQRVFVVIYPEALDHLKKETGVEFRPLEQMVVANWKYVLISNCAPKPF
jgi:hypothetical protein